MCYAESDGNGDRDRYDVKDKVIPRMQKRAEWHLTFRLWLVFLLTDFPAYIAFRTAVRMGNFKLRMAALRRLAPIFCMTGKDRYQNLAAHHLSDLAAMPDTDMGVLSELFSVSMGGDPLGDIEERVRGTQDNNDLHRGAEADTTRMMESILQDFT